MLFTALATGNDMQIIQFTILHSDLSCTSWRFWLDGQVAKIVLDSYVEMTRASKRHKWVAIPGRIYSRLSHRQQDAFRGEIKITEEVIRQVREYFNNIPIVH